MNFFAFKNCSFCLRCNKYQCYFEQHFHLGWWWETVKPCEDKPKHWKRTWQYPFIWLEKHAGACRWRANPLAWGTVSTNAQHKKKSCAHTVSWASEWVPVRKTQLGLSSPTLGVVAWIQPKPLRGLRHISLLTNHLITVETHCLGLHTFDPCTWYHTQIHSVLCEDPFDWQRSNLWSHIWIIKSLIPYTWCFTHKWYGT